MFGFGIPELVIILIIVLVVFGAGKLPEIAGATGKSITNFKKAASGKEDTVQKAAKEIDSETISKDENTKS